MPPEVPRPPSLILVTVEVAEAVDGAAVFTEGRSFTTVPSSASVRPRLATLLTGRLPAAHGVRDPVRHAPAVATVADRLRAAGWDIERVGSPPLHPGETWGFQRTARTNTPALVWMHGEDRVSEAVQLHDDHPDSVLVVTSLDEDARTFVCGDVALPSWPDPIGHVDLGATLLAIAEVTAPADGRDLRGAPSGTLLTEDARSLARGGGVLIGDTPRLHDAPSVSVYPLDVRAWRQEGVEPGDPRTIGSERVPDPVAFDDVATHLSAGRLTLAERGVRALEARWGRSWTTARWQLEIATRRRGLQARIEALRRRADVDADPAAAVELLESLTDLDQYGEVYRRATDQLIRWSDQWDSEATEASFRALRAEAAQNLGLDPSRDLVWLDAFAPRLAEQVAIRVDLAAERQVAWHRWRFATGLDRARLAWSDGDAEDAIRRLEFVLEEQPYALGPRILRAQLALDAGDPDTVQRILAPVRGLDDRLDELYRQSLEMSAAERARIEALRAAFRGSR